MTAHSEEQLPAALPCTSPVLSVLLINSFSRDGIYVTPPMGLIKLAARLIESGHSCRVLDYDIEGDEEALQRTAEGEYDVIGFSVTHFRMEFDLDRLWAFQAAAQAAKKRIYFVAGGQEATLNYRQWLLAGVELIFLGFAEKQLSEFCDKLANQRDEEPSIADLAAEIQGVSYPKEDNRYEVIHRPAPQMTTELFRELFYDDVLKLDVDYDRYWGIVRERFPGASVSGANFVVENVRLYATSHCPMRCGFCSSQTFLSASQDGSARVTMLASGELIQLILHYVDRYGARMAQFSDDDFILGARGIRRAIEFADEIVRLKAAGRIPQEFQFSCQARVADFFQARNGARSVNIDLISALARAGFAGVSLGIETFSERLMRAPSINKLGTTVADCEAILDALLEGGIVPQINLILGIPESTVEDLIHSMLTISDYIERGCDVALVTLVEAFPGAPMTKDPSYQVRTTNLTNPLNREDVRVELFFLPKEPLILKVCESYNDALALESAQVRERYGWEGKIIHKRIAAFSSLLTVARLMERPLLVDHFLCAMDRIVARARAKVTSPRAKTSARHEPNQWGPSTPR